MTVFLSVSSNIITNLVKVAQILTIRCSFSLQNKLCHIVVICHSAMTSTLSPWVKFCNFELVVVNVRDILHVVRFFIEF